VGVCWRRLVYDDRGASFIHMIEVYLDPPFMNSHHTACTKFKYVLRHMLGYKPVLRFSFVA